MTFQYQEPMNLTIILLPSVVNLTSPIGDRVEGAWISAWLPLKDTTEPFSHCIYIKEQHRALQHETEQHSIAQH